MNGVGVALDLNDWNFDIANIPITFGFDNKLCWENAKNVFQNLFQNWGQLRIHFFLERAQQQFFFLKK